MSSYQSSLAKKSWRSSDSLHRKRSSNIYSWDMYTISPNVKYRLLKNKNIMTQWFVTERIPIQFVRLPGAPQTQFLFATVPIYSGTESFMLLLMLQISFSLELRYFCCKSFNYWLRVDLCQSQWPHFVQYILSSSSDTGIVGLNPAQSMDVCTHFLCVCVALCK
jgi:hypothetical protein